MTGVTSQYETRTENKAGRIYSKSPGKSPANYISEQRGVESTLKASQSGENKQLIRELVTVCRSFIGSADALKTFISTTHPAPDKLAINYDNHRGELRKMLQRIVIAYTTRKQFLMLSFDLLIGSKCFPKRPNRAIQKHRSFLNQSRSVCSSKPQV